MANYSSNDELIHYGVLGMKWGKRKARNQAFSDKLRKRANEEYGKSQMGQMEKLGERRILRPIMMILVTILLTRSLVITNPRISTTINLSNYSPTLMCCLRTIPVSRLPERLV